MQRYEDPDWRRRMRIVFDANHMMAEAVGAENGIRPEEIEALGSRLAQAHQALERKRESGALGWMKLPYETAAAEELQRYAVEVRQHFESFVVVGIGGSALGNIALHTALNHPFYNLLPRERRGGPRLFVTDNIDPDLIGGVLDLVDPARTLFNVITKSGSTVETMATFLVFRSALQERLGADFADHLVATTDAQQGALLRIARSEGYRTFAIPPTVGGRFSVLSPVGLLSAAATGIDIRELLAGAAYADGLCRNPDVWQNPAYLNATLQYLAYGKGKHISVMMPYAQRLRDVADWFRQLWAESLGKERTEEGQVVNVGPTPVKALGVTDQHSQLQLYMEGPYDKVVNFLVVERFQRDIPIPSTFGDLEAVGYLGSHSLSELMAAEQRGTELALTRHGRPNCKHILPEVNAFTVGQLLYMLEVQTAFSGELYHVNAFDQPGVEAGKQIAYALLGHPAYAGRREEVDAGLAPNPRYVVG